MITVQFNLPKDNAYKQLPAVFTLSSVNVGKER